MVVKKEPLTPADFAAKVDWEGGVTDVLYYGLAEDDLDGSDPGLKAAWVSLCEAWPAFKYRLDRLAALLEQYEV